ncbi:WbqC family protein [Adhaeribacter pallidiroseus]|uniref:Uncharacterized protein n=1 Tax=Adhaeribacter pallidiroseus TaxID=2072847 RepID=A0A369QEL9_9BACT|nr:WbqC family protein [Adhaeribacter pallidiroseus]RDC61687.1 hypothetical protein AHMF7616_00267 [Adhaeribacter pallidiroseus]
MKNLKTLLVFVLTCAILTSSCESNSKNIREPEVKLTQQSLWNNRLKSTFVNKYAKSNYDKYVLEELVKENEYERSEKELEQYLNSKTFDNYRYLKSTNYVVIVDDIAGKSKSQIEEIFGEPNKKEKVNPSNANCPCDKYTYLSNRIEIVFINKKADWITINNPAFTRVANESAYVSVNRFDDYTYVKVNTK